MNILIAKFSVCAVNDGFVISAFLRQELKKLGLGGEVDLQVLEVPVEYQKVQSLVPSLWKQYRPLVRRNMQNKPAASAQGGLSLSHTLTALKRIISHCSISPALYIATITFFCFE